MEAATRHLTLLVGLPATGKTTFLAALYHVSEDGDVPGALQIKLLTGDRTYLNEIRDRWLRCEEAQHTSAGKEEEVVLLFDDKDDRTFEVAVPDMSGESFAGYWEGRSWPASFDTRVAESEGVLLFLHPNELKEGPTIESMNAVLSAIDESEGSAPSSPQAANTGSVAEDDEPTWDPATSPDQVKVVDVLQCIAHRRNAYPPIAVVVSAWDTQPDGVNPSDWLADRAPLLSQYLQSHEEQAPHRVYGISAQGGDVRTERDRLLALTPSQRIKVVGHEVSDEHDVTAPLRWLLQAGGGKER